ncbi:MAG: hypothetical protein HY516_00295 [Candidatus Aenigmarchaeota archaeon]|nr:hypothetical protein [Candidatus Aenigmarchaeota archaeon]
MFEFAKKLLFTGQFKMEKGSLTILTHRFMIIPVKVITSITKNAPEAKKYLYYGAKEGGVDFAEALIKSFKLDSVQKLEELLINTFNLGGWGDLEIVKNDMQNKLAIFRIKNSAMALEYGKSSEAVCHTNRGFLAGGASRVYGADMDCIETKCISAGDTVCEFITANKDYLSGNFPDLLKKQVLL